MRTKYNTVQAKMGVIMNKRHKFILIEPKLYILFTIGECGTNDKGARGSKINCAEHECMNMSTPRIELATPLWNTHGKNLKLKLFKKRKHI